MKLYIYFPNNITAVEPYPGNCVDDEENYEKF